MNFWSKKKLKFVWTDNFRLTLWSFFRMIAVCRCQADNIPWMTNWILLLGALFAEKKWGVPCGWEIRRILTLFCVVWDVYFSNLLLHNVVFFGCVCCVMLCWFQCWSVLLCVELVGNQLPVFQLNFKVTWQLLLGLINGLKFKLYCDSVFKREWMTDSYFWFAEFWWIHPISNLIYKNCVIIFHIKNKYKY